MILSDGSRALPASRSAIYESPSNKKIDARSRGLYRRFRFFFSAPSCLLFCSAPEALFGSFTFFFLHASGFGPRALGFAYRTFVRTRATSAALSSCWSVLRSR